MATDFTLILENRPGTIAELGEATGRAGVNLDGICGFPCEGRGEIHVVVEDAEAARSAFDDAGVEISGTREVVTVDVANQPGTLGAVARRIAETGANVDLIYVTMNGQLVIGADDLEKVRSAV